MEEMIHTELRDEYLYLYIKEKIFNTLATEVHKRIDSQWGGWSRILNLKGDTTIIISAEFSVKTTPRRLKRYLKRLESIKKDYN